MQSQSRATETSNTATRYQSQQQDVETNNNGNAGTTTNNDLWEQQILSEQLYNAYCRTSSKRGKSNHGGSFMTEKASDIAQNFLQARIETQPEGSFYNQSQGPAAHANVQLKQEHSNVAQTAANSVVAKQINTNALGVDYAQYPETMSISSQSSLEEAYFFKAESIQIDDQFSRLFHKQASQLENRSHTRRTQTRKSRRQMQEEINQLKLDLLACKEQLQQANQSNQVLEQQLKQQEDQLSQTAKSKMEDKGVQASIDKLVVTDAALEKHQLVIEARSAVDTETDSNNGVTVATEPIHKSQSVQFSDSVADIKIEAQKTIGSENKVPDFSTQEEVKEQEVEPASLKQGESLPLISKVEQPEQVSTSEETKQI